MSTERLKEILADLRTDEQAAQRDANAAEEEGDCAFNEGKALAFKIAADRIAGEIQEIEHA